MLSQTVFLMLTTTVHSAQFDFVSIRQNISILKSNNSSYSSAQRSDTLARELLEEFRQLVLGSDCSSKNLTSCPSLPSLPSLLTGLLYVQLYHNLSVEQVVSGAGLQPKDGAKMATAAEVLGRLDLGLAWLEWAGPPAGEERGRLEAARERSDRVLLEGGGVSYNTTSLTFLVSRSWLHRQRSQEEEERGARRQRAQLVAVEDMPHREDMFHDPSYMNRLSVVRTDLAGELCRGNTSRRLPR